jgi:hypothetical protein
MALARGGEQLIYSHRDRVDHHDNNTPWRYELNKVRQLLVAGDKDNYKGTLNFAAFSNIFDNTRSLSELMAHTPGRSLFLKDTGHSIHSERPRFFAGKIVNFLVLSEPALKATDISFLTPLLLSEPDLPALKTTDISFLAPLLLSEPG